jgi:hypothetical protein
MQRDNGVSLIGSGGGGTYGGAVTRKIKPAAMTPMNNDHLTHIGHGFSDVRGVMPIYDTLCN